MVAGVLGIISAFIFCIFIMRMQLVEIRELKLGHCKEPQTLVEKLGLVKNPNQLEIENLQKVVDNLVQP